MDKLEVRFRCRPFASSLILATAPWGTIKMSYNEKEGVLPSYEDSISGAPNQTSRLQNSQVTRTQSPSRGQQILDNLTLVRARHLHDVINESIIPIVEQQALYGIAQTTIAMIPSDVPLPIPEAEKSEFSFNTSNERNIQVIGFSSEEEPQIVRLEGHLNRTEFWRPQVIVEELERLLKESLNESPHFRPPIPRETVSQAVPSKQVRRNFFGRMANVMNNEERMPDQTPEDRVHHSIDTSGQVLVKARLEEICLRTMNDFGLYDTISKQCIIIHIDARC